MRLAEALLARFPRLRNVPSSCRIAVGGAVRDLLLGREPLDVDVECDDPLAVAQSFNRKVITLGREALTAHRVVDGNVIYDFSPTSPLGRRDFTINAIAVDLQSGEVVDPFAGRDDIERGLVRMIDAKNFDDDPLRLLRAVRFAATLDFEIEDETLNAIRARAGTITSVSAERVTYELSLIMPRFAPAAALLRETRLDVPIFQRGADSQSALAGWRAGATEVLPLAAAYALAVDDPRAFAERWRWSESLLRDVLTLQRLRKSRTLVDLYDAGESLAIALQSIVDEPIVMPDFSIRPLLDGEEIANIAGIEPGPRVGTIKRAMIEAQLEGKIATREDAEEFVRATASK
jgi:tRNA nucleotidyltransferase/poly(A) polymerase